MKIQTISCFIFSCLLILPGAGYSADERICKEGVYMFFGNGVWNDEEAADSSRRLLTRRMESKIAGSELEGIITYATAYNPTEGKIRDLLETFEQNAQTDTSQFWRFLAGLDPLPDFLQNKLIEIANEVDAEVVSSNPAVQNHIEKYNQFLSEGNKVVVVAHSQGNLFANIAYLGLDAQYKEGFGIVSVGNPDNHVAGDGPYTTLEEDIIIGNVVNSMPANLDNFFGINLRDLSGHKFADSYMASGKSAETKILNDAVNSINGLSFPETDLSNGIVTATLSWGSNPDLDLHIFEPNGAHVFYRNLIGPSGYLDRDDVDGYGPEHYYVSCDTLEPGTYRFGVNYYYGTSNETGMLTLKAGDQIRTRQHIFTEVLGYNGDSSPYTMFDLYVSGSKEEGYQFFIQ